MKNYVKEQYIEDFYVLLSYYLIMLFYRLFELLIHTNTFLPMGLLIGYSYLGMWCYKSYQNNNISKVNKITKIALVATVLPIFVLSLSYSTVEIFGIILHTFIPF